MAGELRELGIVKFYNPRKGYGFVTRPDGSDVFFHLTHFRSATNPALGSVVQFTLGENREGPTAEDMVQAAPDEVDRYGGTIVALDDDGGSVMTPDNYEVRFRRSDFIPHARADSLRVGDDVEMNFLVEEPDGWRAAVVRPPDFEPEPLPARSDRRDGDDEEENRRLLGILYKTDLDEEALHAGRTLAERNMRATLSALVSRLFDRRLSHAARTELLSLCAAVYFDDECRTYLVALSTQLAAALSAEDEEVNPAAAEALRTLLDDERFPVRWSQYLLPFGLTLLRQLVAIPASHAVLSDPACDPAGERWLARVCRHVEQRRSGFGYVLSTAIGTFDELWQRDCLQAPIRRTLARLLLALDADGLAQQLHHLRDRLSPTFLSVLMPALSQHPELPAALRHSGQADVLAGWVEALLAETHATLPTEVLAALLPLVEETRAQAAGDDALQRLARPVTEGLSRDEVVRLLGEEDLPARAGWACLRHLESRGDLPVLLADPEARGVITAWLKRAAERPAPVTQAEPELGTALKLIESLRGREELRGELSDIGHSLFAGVQQRVAQAQPPELQALLEQFDLEQLPGLAAALARRLLDEQLDDATRRRVVASFVDHGPPLAELGTALAAWQRDTTQRGALVALVNALEAGAATGDAEAQAVAEVAREALRAAEVTWMEGFVTALEPGLDGAPRARVQGFNILLPERLFSDKADFAVNHYVRLLLRRGIALGVERAEVPEAGCVCGRLAGPLEIDERDAVVGLILDLHGARCYFEVASMKSGRERALAEGDLLRFTRLAAAAGAYYDYVAFNVHAEFTAAEVPLLLETLVQASDAGVATAAWCQAVALTDELDVLRAALAQAAPARRELALAACDESVRAQLTS